nr:MAG TPA: hypothetical protein [Caudoviricetes sp.]
MYICVVTVCRQFVAAQMYVNQWKKTKKRHL